MTLKSSITFAFLKDGLVVIEYFFYISEGCLVFRACNTCMGGIFISNLGCRSLAATIK